MDGLNTILDSIAYDKEKDTIHGIKDFKLLSLNLQNLNQIETMHSDTFAINERYTIDIFDNEIETCDRHSSNSFISTIPSSDAFYKIPTIYNDKLIINFCSTLSLQLRAWFFLHGRDFCLYF